MGDATLAYSGGCDRNRGDAPGSRALHVAIRWMLGIERGGQALAEHKRKRRTREHVIADLSANHVERFVLRCGHIVERPAHDYGIDLVMNTFDVNGEIENGDVRIQLKATDSLVLTNDQQAIVYRLKRTDIRRWCSEPDPVILVVYDAPSDVAYWIYVQAYFEQLPSFDPDQAGVTFTIHIPRSNTLSEDAIRQFARFRDDVLRQRRGVVRHHE